MKFRFDDAPFLLYLSVSMICIVLGLFSAYLFYFGDCELIKKYWYLVQTPGRCL